ncbi:MAG TPA: hypothetical protein VL501_06930 [Pyrinomonadaceae bacterium]|nr:hypothetical protein [Pyrinomonadaceae bacterium]
MVNRIHTDTARSPRISDNKERETSDRAISAKLFSDDIISSLANAHENRRARQVTEWQQLGAKTFRAAA